ncbi:MAG: molybdopterin molybdotransferase MoeA [Phycisphaerae bacterium]
MSHTTKGGELISFVEARSRLSALAAPLPPVWRTVDDAVGCRLADAVHAEIEWPDANVAMMDGYAVRAAEFTTPRAAAVAFEIAAGTVPPRLPPGTAARIFTGAALPEGADAVVRQEDAAACSENAVRIPAVESGQFVRWRGEIARIGGLLAADGEPVTPQIAGLLAVVGPQQVRVTPRPRLAILATGSELIAPTAPRRAGVLRDGNTLMLSALARRAGFDVTHAVRVPDDLSQTCEALTNLFDHADVLLSTGGVSVGDYDFVPRAIGELGGEILFHHVNIKPGRPILAARRQAKWLLALPGNPASALVGWCLFGAPLCRALSGTSEAFSLRSATRPLACAIENPSGRLLFAPARVAQDGAVTALPWKGSHDVMALAHAEAFLAVAPRTKCAEGTLMDVYSIEAISGEHAAMTSG